MKRFWVAAAALAIQLAMAAPAFPVVIESGDFVAHVRALEQLTFTANSNLYVAPSAANRSAFYTLACTLRAGNISAADVQAGALDYDLVQFTDTASGQTYQGLRERLVGGSPTRGWGSYFINLSAGPDALIEAPHPRFDMYTPEIGATVFTLSGASGFLMAGAHRNANGTGTADVAHLTDSIFQEVHKAWVGLGVQTIAWQIHGYNGSNYPSFPAGTDAVLSAGDGGVSDEIIRLDGAFADWGLLCFAYNTLSISDPLNITVNETYPGTTFSSLGATTNVQGIYSRSLGGSFVHIEMEQSIRFDASNRYSAAQLIGGVIPEPGTAVLLTIGMGILLARRRPKRTAHPA